jgi:hypothetical protein
MTMSEHDDENFNHDLLIANVDGKLLHIPHEEWNQEKYVIKDEHFEEIDGWKLVREMLECGVALAAIPPESKLPEGTPKPLGTCYLVNIEGLKQTHKFHQRTRKR